MAFGAFVRVSRASRAASPVAAELPDGYWSAAKAQEILDAGVTSGVVLYNQGNAFMRAGQTGRAIACYYNHPDHFRELMLNAMRSDYSWNVPGQDYLNIYDFIRNK